MQVFWQSEIAPICYKEEQATFIDTVIKTSGNLRRFFNSLIKKTLLPKLAPSCIDSYRSTAILVMDSWDSDRIKESLMGIWIDSLAFLSP